MRLALFLMLPFALPAQAELPRAASVPGGIALLRLGPVSAGMDRPRAWYAAQRVLVTAEAGAWYALVGLPLDALPGRHVLRVEAGEESRTINFDVAARNYPEQRIQLKDSSKVHLSAADEARAARDIEAIQRYKRHWRDTAHVDTAFKLPANGRLAGRFGVRRVFNGEARAPHVGLDVAVPRGTTVRASAVGKVLAVDDYFFNGKTVIVDHGHGLITLYCHLERIDVRAGALLEKGQAIGLSGMSGRASGPHVHWSVVLNGAMVDPELFVAPSARSR